VPGFSSQTSRATDRGTRQLAEEFLLGAKVRTVAGGKTIDQPKPGIVARALELGAHVAEADDHAYALRDRVGGSHE
jgi:hypothetical protein